MPSWSETAEKIEGIGVREERDELRGEIARLRDAMERAIANLDDNFARRVLIRSLSRKGLSAK